MRLISKINRRLRLYRGKLKLFFSKDLWLSIGENCLTDNILERHGLKSFSTPYSHGRSNIDYALQLERNNYQGLLQLSNLEYQPLNDKMVTRSTLYKTSDDIYNEMHIKGFEFTHHDLIASKSARDSYDRKIERLKVYKGKKRFNFLYHYRVDDANDINKLIPKIKEFKNFYDSPKFPCRILVFTQVIVPLNEARKVNLKSIGDNVYLAELYTHEIWTGTVDDVFWARTDDDLIVKMLEEYKI